MILLENTTSNSNKHHFRLIHSFRNKMERKLLTQTMLRNICAQSRTCEMFQLIIIVMKSKRIMQTRHTRCIYLIGVSLLFSTAGPAPSMYTTNPKQTCQRSVVSSELIPLIHFCNIRNIRSDQFGFCPFITPIWVHIHLSLNSSEAFRAREEQAFSLSYLQKYVLQN